MINKLMYRVLFSVTLALFAAGTAIASTPQWPPPEPVQQRLNQALELIDDLIAITPAWSDDLNDVAFDLAFDVELAIEQVRDEIRFVPYRGVLRGIEGTRRSGAGNSWDQALVLAGLIKTIGGDAQIVRGQISTNDARRLLLSMFEEAEQGDASTSFDLSSMRERVAQYDESLARSLGANADPARLAQSVDELASETSRLEGQLMELLSTADIEISRDQPIDSLLVAVAEDYAWVRWRLGPGDEWQAVHPAFGALAAPEVTIAAYVDEQVPEAHQHRVAFELFIERRSNGRVERVPIMQRFERPTAQLHKEPLSLGLAPLPNGNLDEGALLVPLLNGQLAPGAQAVTALGLTADAGDAATAAGQLFATVSNRMGSALDALSQAAGDDETAGLALLGAILVTELIQPGRPNRSVERRIVDLREAMDDSAPAFPQSAVVGLTLEIDVGTDNEARATREALQQQRNLLAAFPALMASARGVLPPEEAERLPEMNNLGTPRWLDFDLFSGSSLPSPTTTQQVFRDGALLAMRRTFADANGRADGGLISVSDILSNPVMVVRKGIDDQLIIDRQATARQGIRETLLESAMASQDAGWSTRSPGALVSDPAALQRLADGQNWNRRAREMAEADLNEGYVLGVAGTKEPHWWRVHPQTGHTLGMSQHGGSEVVFYVTLVGGALISAWFFRQSVQSCDETYANNQEMADCCIVGNLGATYGTTVVTGGWGASGVAPWAAAVGRLKASTQIALGLAVETGTNVAVGEATSGPIDAICQRYLASGGG
ncbi:MAG: hypothetical protein AAGJ52_08175 [Pseudomonadota bacterium]